MKWAGTSPREANDSRTTLRVPLGTGLVHLHWGVPPVGFSHPVSGRTGRGRHLSPDAWRRMAEVFAEAASATRDKTSDGH
jgi:hypothetical protein